MKKIGVLTSGGDAPGMNSAIRAVVRTALDTPNVEVWGFVGGYEGLLTKECVKLLSTDVSDIIYQGGTFLKAGRCEQFKTSEGISLAVKNLKDLHFDSLICIGGDGSLKGAIELQKQGVNIVFIPATIDNDLGYTERSIGFDTACNTIVDAVSNVRDSSEAHDRAFIIEVMGAFCGDLALYAGIASGADIILLPEVKMEFGKIVSTLENYKKIGKNSVFIMLNEKVSSAEALAEQISKKCSVEIRYNVLGYLQRGGEPTVNDRIIASRFGAEAVQLVLANKSGAVGTSGEDIIVMPLAKASQTKKIFNKKLYKLANQISD